MAAALIAIKNAREAKILHEEAMKAADLAMHEAFDIIDADKTGDLDVDEMLLALYRVNEYNPNAPNAARVKRMVQKAAGKDQTFNFEEYKAFIIRLRTNKNKWKTPVPWLPHNDIVAHLYNLRPVQMFVAAVIVINFIAICLEKEVDPYLVDNQHHFPAWFTVDSVCNIVFIIELLFNLYGSFWRPFVANPWNYLDTLVVLVGACSLLRIELPSPLDQLKILRAFRILRLFKKVESLNKILVALVRSIPGVMNAFFVMFIFMAIYAVLAVDLFRDFGGPGTYDTIQRFGPADGVWGSDGAPYALAGGDPKARIEVVSSNDAITARGFHYGQEYFGTFSRSIFTLFQVLTGESWSEAICRPLLFGWDQGNAFLVGFYFVSFFILTAMVLQNVVVTVLLDAVLSDSTEQDALEKATDADYAGAMAGLQTNIASMVPAGAPAGSRKNSGTQPSPTFNAKEFDLLRMQADKMQGEIASTLDQCQQILKLMPS